MTGPHKSGIRDGSADRVPGLTVSDGAPDPGGASGGATSRATRAVYQRIVPGTWYKAHMYTAPSDGFVLATILHPGSHNKGCVAWGYISFGWSAQVTGGNVGFFGHDWDEYMADNPNSCLHPVGEGWQFSIGVMQNYGEGQQVNAPYEFWWISMTGESVGDYQVTDINIGNRSADADNPQVPLPQAGPAGTQDRQAFIAILERLMGKPIDAKTQEEFLALGRAV